MFHEGDWKRNMNEMTKVLHKKNNLSKLEKPKIKDKNQTSYNEDKNKASIFADFFSLQKAENLICNYGKNHHSFFVEVRMIETNFGGSL